MSAPLSVTCPYCKRSAYQLKGKDAQTEPGRTRYGCDNEHRFVYPEKFGYEPVMVKERA